MLLVAGDADPVCQNGEGSRLLAEAYRGAGMTAVELRRYPQARHELFNETCRDAVTRDLLDWLAPGGLNRPRRRAP